MYRCNNCVYLKEIKNSVPWGNTFVDELLSECALGYDANLGDCPPEAFAPDEGDCMLGGRVITKGWSKAREAGVD